MFGKPGSPFSPKPCLSAAPPAGQQRTDHLDLLAHPHIFEVILSFSDISTMNAFVRASKESCRYAAPHLYRQVTYHPDRYNPFDGTPMTCRAAFDHPQAYSALADICDGSDDDAALASGEEENELKGLHKRFLRSLRLVQKTETITIPAHSARQCDMTHEGCIPLSKNMPCAQSRSDIEVLFTSTPRPGNGCEDATHCRVLAALELIEPNVITTFTSSPISIRNVPDVPLGRPAIPARMSPSRRPSGKYTYICRPSVPCPLFDASDYRMPRVGIATSIVIIFVPDGEQESASPFLRDASCIEILARNLGRIARFDCERLVIVGAENLVNEPDARESASSLSDRLFGGVLAQQQLFSDPTHTVESVTLQEYLSSQEHLDGPRVKGLLGV